MDFDVERCRKQFPALAREIGGRPVVYFDGPAGSQVPARVVEAVGDYLTHHNANEGGAFATSRETDQILAEARRAVADLLGADDPDCVVFGPNMTTLTFALSRALAKTWQNGDEVIVTQLDHDANITPWVLAARDAGATVRQVRINPDDCTLDLDDLEAKLSDRTRLVAVGCASNGVGTINPVGEIVARAHGAGAAVFLDAVHYAPHCLIDVAAWNCDYLACSAYKFFGPHVGILWGRRELLEALPVYKVRPASGTPPGRWMTGTQNHEGIAGVLAAVEYLAEIEQNSLAQRDAGEGAEPQQSTVSRAPCSVLGAQYPALRNRRSGLAASYAAIVEHERRLCARLLDGLGELPDVAVHGITERSRIDRRVPTIAFTHAHQTPDRIAQRLAEQGIFVWAGHHYAVALAEALGWASGSVRIGLLHYNTEQEVDRLLVALREVTA